MNAESTNPAPPQQVQFRTVGEESHEQRLDNYLLSQLKGVPKSRIYRIIRKGEVRVNKGRAKAETRVRQGDVVRIPPIRLAQEATPEAAPSALLARIEAGILHEDAELLVVNKPSGIAVHGGSGVQFGLIEALRQARPKAGFLELVHRLDRDTSGCIMIAKKRSMLTRLHEALQQGRVEKRYAALVHGAWPKHIKHVEAPLEKFTLRSGERRVKVSEQGKQALTRYQIMQRFQAATLLQAQPITGRTHQIRVHCQWAGHAIIGDDKYCADDINTSFAGQGLKRLFLHASSLKVTLPDQARPLQFQAPLPAELDDVVKRLAEEQP